MGGGDPGKDDPIADEEGKVWNETETRDLSNLQRNHQVQGTSQWWVDWIGLKSTVVS